MNPNENTTPPIRKYKRYDEAFQRSKVAHWLLSGKSARQTAAELGLTTQTWLHWQKKFKALSLTDSNHGLPIAPNRLRGLAMPARRAAVWVADIIYVPTDEGWLYVAAGRFGDSLATSPASIWWTARDCPSRLI